MEDFCVGSKPASGAGIRTLAGALICAWSLPALSHHSYAGIDRSSVVAFDGTVLSFEWANPHVYFIVETTNERGETVQWEIETGGTPILARSGWSGDSLRPGEAIAVRAHPDRGTGRRYAVLESLIKQDGTVLRQAARGSDSTASTRTLHGVWKSRAVPGAPIEPLSSLFRAFESLPLTDNGARAKARYDHYRDNPTAQCVGYSVLVTLASPHYLNQIEVLDDRVILHNEWFDAERVVYTDGRAIPDDAEPSVLGRSIGRWEDGVLIVETEKFAAHRSPYGTGLPSSARKRLTERYALADDGRSLTVDVTMQDPEFIEGRFSGSLTWDYTPDLVLYGYDCDPSIAGKYGPDE